MTDSSATRQFTTAASHSAGQILLVATLVTTATIGAVFALSAPGVAVAFAVGALTAVLVSRGTAGAESQAQEVGDRVAAAPPYTLEN